MITALDSVVINGPTQSLDRETAICSAIFDARMHNKKSALGRLSFSSLERKDRDAKLSIGCVGTSALSLHTRNSVVIATPFADNKTFHDVRCLFDAMSIITATHNFVGTAIISSDRSHVLRRYLSPYSRNRWHTVAIIRRRSLREIRESSALGRTIMLLNASDRAFSARSREI